MTFKVSYIPGPGDVVGTYEYWREGLEDPRVPVMTYSSMMYTTIKNFNAKLQVITPYSPPESFEEWILFSKIPEVSKNKNYFLSQIERLKVIRNELDKFSPKVVIVASDIPTIFLFMLKSSKWKLCLSIHNTYWPGGRNPPNGFKAWIKRQLIRINLGFIDTAICTSRECARQLKILRSSGIKVRTELPVVRHKITPNQSKKVQKLVFLGRIEQSKGIFMLADCVNRLSQDFPELKCTFAGSGSDSNKFIEHLTELNNDKINYVGRLSAEKVHELLHNSDLLVVPTTTRFNEGLALVGFEAAVHMVPSLFSDVVPAHEYFEGACSIFEADNKDDLELKLKKLIMDNDFYMLLKHKLSFHIRNISNHEQSWGDHVTNILKHHA